MPAVLAAAWALLAVAFLAAQLVVRLPGSDGGISGVLQDLIRYGKAKRGYGQRPAWLRLLQVPKRWFTHFYVVSVLWNGCLLLWLFRAEFLGGSLPSWIQPVHRALGRDSQSEDTGKELSVHVSWYHIVGVAMYVWASLHQHRCLVILANLRKTKSGKVISLSHSVPFGDWFERVSCPHYFAELLIYVSMAITFGFGNVTWWCVVMYILFNQALAAVLCHEFYQNNFSSYPKHRKAFIPFVF
ncbi:polyprenal reductase isoform 5-T5 [Chlamydotis macqueenii]